MKQQTSAQEFTRARKHLFECLFEHVNLLPQDEEMFLQHLFLKSPYLWTGIIDGYILWSFTAGILEH